MIAKKLDNGNLLVPVTAEIEGEVIGDAFEEIDPDHKDYEKWLKFIDGVEDAS